VELGRRHRAGELRLAQHLAEEGIGLEQDVLIEQDVVDADGALLAQLDVVGPWRPGVNRVAERVVRVVIQVGPGRDDPVDEARLDQRHQARGGEPWRRERARERQRDRDVGLEDLATQELRRLA
jgi:hypothetical protein